MTVGAKRVGSAAPGRVRAVDVHGHRGPRYVLLSWGALLVNVLAPSGVATVIPLPRSLAQVIAQGALVAALLLALQANPRMVVRPSAFLVLLSILALVSFVVSLHNEFVVGSTYRGLRLLCFVAVLWLLTPWWGRHDLMLLRVHRLCLWAVLATVAVGAAVAPGKAFAFEGRLAGTLWPIPPTQVAHYAAVLFGTTVILWLCRVITGLHALVATVVSTAALVGTHSRTPLVGIGVGLTVASMCLFLGHARVRRMSVSSLVGAVAATVLFAPQIVTWLARGQSADEVGRLTGRTDVWVDVVAAPRPLVEQFVGAGLSNKSYDGLPIDSNWIATYLDQGWFGLVVEVTILLLLLLAAATHGSGPRRAVALFLVVYAIAASVTETGLGDASPYLLDLAVAASLLASPALRSPVAQKATP